MIGVSVHYRLGVVCSICLYALMSTNAEGRMVELLERTREQITVFSGVIGRNMAKLKFLCHG
jgi:hypothetical protein